MICFRGGLMSKFRSSKKEDRVAIRTLIGLERDKVIEPKGDVRWYVVEEGEDIIACSALVLEREGEAVLSAVVVHPDWRGKVIPVFLLADIILAAANLGIRKLRAITPYWRWLHRRLGFRLTDTDIQKELKGTSVESLTTFPLMREVVLLERA